MHRLVLIARCAGVGALCRYELYSGAQLWILLGINCAGAALFGVCRHIRQPLRSYLTTGFCGGFTSFSAAAVLILDLPLAGFIGYSLLTAVGCVVAVVLGERLAPRRWAT